MKPWRMPTNFFGTVRPEIFDRKTWYSLFCKFFPIRQFFWIIAGMLTIFSALWDHFFQRRNVMRPPPPFIRKNFSKREFFSKIGGFLHKNFRHCEMNNFRREIVTPFLCIKFFDYPKFLKNWRDAYAFSGTVRHEIFDRKTWFTSYA